MSKQKHTPTPLEYSKGKWYVEERIGEYPFIRTDTPHPYGDPTVTLGHKGNLERIVACVNALAGIDDVENWLAIIGQALTTAYGHLYELPKNDPHFNLYEAKKAIDSALELFPKQSKL